MLHYLKQTNEEEMIFIAAIVASAIITYAVK